MDVDRNEGKRKFTEFFLSKESFWNNFYQCKVESYQNLKGFDLPDDVYVGLTIDRMSLFDLSYVSFRF